MSKSSTRCIPIPVSAAVNRHLADQPNITLMDPLEYVPFVDLMQRSYFLLTDSGGIQEEAPSLGKPVLVLRENTERPEAVRAGTAKLVGTDERRIVEEAEHLLEDPIAYQRMARGHSPYGDGRSSQKIADFLVRGKAKLDSTPERGLKRAPIEKQVSNAYTCGGQSAEQN